MILDTAVLLKLFGLKSVDIYDRIKGFLNISPLFLLGIDIYTHFNWVHIITGSRSEKINE